MIRYETEGQREYRLRREWQEQRAPSCTREGCSGRLLGGGYDVYCTEKGVWKPTKRHKKSKLCRACAEAEATRRNQEAKEAQRLMHSTVRYTRI